MHIGFQDPRFRKSRSLAVSLNRDSWDINGKMAFFPGKTMTIGKARENISENPLSMEVYSREHQ